MSFIHYLTLEDRPPSNTPNSSPGGKKKSSFISHITYTFVSSVKTPVNHKAWEIQSSRERHVSGFSTSVSKAKTSVSSNMV